MKLLKFYTDWCQPCKVLSTYITNNPNQFPIDISNVCADGGGDIEQELTRKFKIRSVPTCVLVDDQENEIARCTSSSGYRVYQFLSMYLVDPTGSLEGAVKHVEQVRLAGT